MKMKNSLSANGNLQGEPAASCETLEAGNLRLQLRADLEFQLQDSGGETGYVIRDEANSRFYRVGLTEGTIISLFRCGLSLEEVVRQASRRLGDQAVTLDETLRIAHWLLESGLVLSVDERGQPNTDAEHFQSRSKARSRQKAMANLNPLFLRIPLGDPHHLLLALSPWLGWITTYPFFVVWLGTILYATLRLAEASDLLSASLLQIWTPDAWIWMLVTMVVLKLIHEIAHGLFCEKWGGRVSETGIALILCFPMPYVDVTSSWIFPSKWKRISVAAAGMYVELFLAAMAAIVWSYSTEPVWRFHAFNVFLLGSVTSILFNANFLMRFDGYYILSDLLEIPNLYQKGQSRMAALGHRFLLGIPFNLERGDRTRDGLIWIYGLLALAWRWLICISLCVAATTLFYGFGMILALFALALWLGTPVVRLVKQWRDPASNLRPNFRWMALVPIPTLVLLVFGIQHLPWPFQISAPAVVEYRAPAVVRAASAGFVSKVHVQPGQFVSQGELLVTMANRELAAEFRLLQLSELKSQIRQRSLFQQQDIAALKAEEATEQSLSKKLRELEQKLSQLQIRAVADGIVDGDDLPGLTGTYVAEGTELMRVVNEQQKKITAAIQQETVDYFQANVTQVAYFRPSFQTNVVPGMLLRVEPMADGEVDPRLSSVYGGSLPVIRPNTSKTSDRGEPAQSFRLIHARFLGEIEVDGVQARQLRAGTVGYVQLERYGRSVGSELAIAMSRWWNRLMNQIQR